MLDRDPIDEPVCLNCNDYGCEYCGPDYADEVAEECELDGPWFPEDDGQPDEYTEWQDVYGGDDWDNGQFDCDEW